MSARIFLFRHGQAATGGLMTGQRDVPLSPEGEAEVLRWHERLAKTLFDAAYSSPLLRARQTASLLLGMDALSVHEPVLVEDLREICLGRWEGRSKLQVMQEDAQSWEARGRDIVGVAPPEGESVRQLAGRVLPAFRAVLSQSVNKQNVLVVAHQAVNRVILAEIEDIPLDRILSIPQPTAVLNLLEIDAHGRARLRERSLPDG